jgi:hypothetical protein
MRVRLDVQWSRLTRTTAPILRIAQDDAPGRSYQNILNERAMLTALHCGTKIYRQLYRCDLSTQP